MYQKQTYWSLNGYSSNLWSVRLIGINGPAGSSYSSSNSFGLRPVTTLKSTILITGGTGTSLSPYVIKWE